ncbi:MAG: hypothetical protein A2W90_09480 [Bacteroidetes bacterium GWF2_42_66]|nr:MAG: hypothetical protein A2W92_00170 [Bacteroidetes bacterium GWA2_42_15]OFY01736.1 MAG: hypothetical protein A2W89_22685 [Bacteroidetes bacterium GWE2_42_39]OFY46483.1 MAG: hypothetical protein A2W90_09480 [Bacteroidetes bacterium GWF2_42_66]
MPDNAFVGAEKQYWVDSIVGSESTYTWKINHVIQQTGSVNLFSNTWNTVGAYLLEVQETLTGNCPGEVQSGWVYVHAAPVLEIICPTIEVLCAVETVPAYADLESFLLAGGIILNNCTLNSASFRLSFERITVPGYPEPYSITREYSVSDICGSIGKCTQTILISGVLTGNIASQTNVSVPGGNNGSVTVAGSGGTAPYQYKLGSGNYQVSGTFNSLISGDYIVTVQDNNRCTFDVPVTITQPLTPLSGIKTSHENVLCFGENTGSVTVAGSGGTTPYEYILNEGFYQTSGTFNTLPAGNYVVTVRDAMLNTFAIPVTIAQPTKLTVSATQTNILCFGNNTGSATATATGGTVSYSYSWDTSPVQTSATANNLSTGVYTVIVTDGNGCTATSSVTIVAINSLPLAEFTSVFSELMTYSFTDGSTNATTYAWDFGDGHTSTSANPTNAYATTGTYTVTLIVSNSCGTDITTQVITVEIPDLEFYNGFSPNGDGLNDYWKIPVLSYYPENSVKIINRWGSKVWMGSDYNNTSKIWTGQNMNGNNLPDGTYYYIINYSKFEKRGWVFIKR